MEEITSMYDTLTELAKDITHLREAAGLSKAKFARVMNVAYPTVETLERYPRVALLTLFKVARVLDQKLVIRLEPRSPRGK